MALDSIIPYVVLTVKLVGWAKTVCLWVSILDDMTLPTLLELV
ncbi:hypothetical protein [Moorena sp. SIO3H5]|nr:hypothetical protein [Moorena sp. SIO3H5]